jgi:hypothetical protein
MDIENDQIINSAEGSLNVLNMILETPSFKVTNIIFESYEHRSKIILQLLTSFVFLKVGFVPHELFLNDVRNFQI